MFPKFFSFEITKREDIDEEKVINIEDDTTSIQIISSIPSIPSFFLSKVFERLIRVRNLYKVVLLGFYMTPSQLKGVCDMLLKNSFIADLTLPFFEKADELVEVLANNLVPLQCLSIQLNCCTPYSFFSSSVAKAISDVVRALSTNQTVTAFTIYGTMLDSHFFILKAMEETLVKNHTLTSFKYRADYSYGKLYSRIDDRLRENRKRGTTLLKLLIDLINDETISDRLIGLTDEEHNSKRIIDLTDEEPKSKRLRHQ